MIQVLRVAGLALRELWISYRLLALLALSLLGGLVSAIDPGSSGTYAADPLALAWGSGLVAVVAAAMAGLTLAADRRAGRFAWLVVRGVPRSTILLGWFAAFAGLLTAGTLAGGLLAWLALAATGGPPVDGLSFSSLAAAAAAGGWACVSLGLVVGALVRRPLPVTAAATLGAALLVGPGLVLATMGDTGQPGQLPAVGPGLLASATSLQRPLSDGVEALGVGLAASALLLAAAAAAISRVEL